MPTFTEEDFHFLTKEIENPDPPNQLSVEENKWAAKNADFDIKRFRLTWLRLSVLALRLTFQRLIARLSAIQTI